MNESAEQTLFENDFLSWNHGEDRIKLFALADDGTYCDWRVQDCWQSWQSRAALAPVAQEPVAWGVSPDDKTTVGELAAHVGAWETPDGHVTFGSWMAVSAFRHHILKGAAKQWQQMATTTNKFGDKLRPEAQAFADGMVEGVKTHLATPQPPVQAAELAGCACRWNAGDKRIATCERHQGWLDVIAEWADRAREAEAKLKAAPQEAAPLAKAVEPKSTARTFDRSGAPVPSGVASLSLYGSKKHD